MYKFATECLRMCKATVNKGKCLKDLDKCFISSYEGVSKGQIPIDSFCYCSTHENRKVSAAPLFYSWIFYPEVLDFCIHKRFYTWA